VDSLVAIHAVATAGSRWQRTLANLLMDLPRGTLTVAVRDRQGNLSKIERTFSIRR
jgi:hypothetical protein